MSPAKAWLFVLSAGVLEVVWTVSMKRSEGFTRPLAAAVCVLSMLASFALLLGSLKALPVGTAYAVWTGIGAAGTALFGAWLFHEPLTAVRIGCIALIVAGIAGLKFFPG